MEATFFATEQEFRKWLEENHKTATELIVGYYKVSSGKATMSWSQSVDQAVCFGWIDGIRKSIDKDRYQIRFTPRKASSMWSTVNIRKVEKLKKLGLMKAEGLARFDKRKEYRSNVYSHENKGVKLPSEFQKQFEANEKAWDYFSKLAPSYKKASINWVMTAKQLSTQLRRLKVLIKDSEEGTNKWKYNKYNKKP